ncbi:MAG: PBP1A family penicillin-binding protein [Proteobacteria bacterium]|nr:PBP1A family penicillin-binding protein [Pseudomonadota bacterium]
MSSSKKPPSWRKEPTFLKKSQMQKKKGALYADTKSPSRKKTRQKGLKKRHRPFMGRLLKWFFLFLVWGVILGGFILGYFAYDLPNLESLKPGVRRPSITFKSFQGKTLCTYGDSQEKNYTLNEISPLLIKAVIAIEDRRFYTHKGIDLIGIARAFWINMRQKSVVQGGSTLTQQLAKNLFLTSQRSLKRKIQEVMLALWLEHTFTKDQILSIYLNRVYLGSGMYGVGAASHKYFHKSPSQLSLYESALLAGLLKAPSYYGSFQNKERAHQRAGVVLEAMIQAGMITPWEKTEALVQMFVPDVLDVKIEGIRYFCDWIMRELPKYIGDLNVQDLIITTTLDPRLQIEADKSIESALKTSTSYKDLQVALISLSLDGAVRAMIGGKSYEKSQFNRAYQALRQPGSLFKIFIFLSALESGRSSQDLISDAHIRIGKWAPKNYQWQSRGMISLKEALAYSVNTATVRLAQQIGLRALQRTAQNLGIKSPISNNLSVALGTSEVTLLEISSAFAIIANGGYKVEPYGIVRIETKNGKVLYERSPLKRESVISSEIATQMQIMLHDVVTYGRGKEAAVPGIWIAGKTGTTQQKQDAWFVGFTHHLVTGIWLGIDENEAKSALKKKKRPMGGGLPALLFKKFMGSI